MGNREQGTEYFNAKESNRGLKKSCMISFMICTQLCTIKGECVLDEWCIWACRRKKRHACGVLVGRCDMTY